MAWLNAVVLIYALLNIGGGIEGYITKHSVPSVISGVIAGVVVIAGAALAQNMPKPGYAICAVIAAADLAFFGMKLSKSFTVWPAAIMAGASIIVIVCVLIGLLGSKPVGP